MYHQPVILMPTDDYLLLSSHSLTFSKTLLHIHIALYAYCSCNVASDCKTF